MLHSMIDDQHHCVSRSSSPDIYTNSTPNNVIFLQNVFTMYIIISNGDRGYVHIIYLHGFVFFGNINFAGSK